MHTPSTQKHTHMHKGIYITVIDSSSIPRSDYLHTFNTTGVKAMNVLACTQTLRDSAVMGVLVQKSNVEHRGFSSRELIGFVCERASSFITLKHQKIKKSQCTPRSARCVHSD